MQDFEGHGCIIPQPLERGFVPSAPRLPSRPTTAASESGEASSQQGSPSKRSGRRKKAAAFIVHVHLRDKILSVNVGEGAQCIYWLGLTAVQRYVRQPDSYSSPFSQELTPKRVISDEGQPLDNNARVRDEFNPEDHCWIDVGDGVPLSTVKSRHVLETGGAFEPPPEEVSERIYWVQLDVDDEEEEVDERPAMRYARFKLPERPPFAQWQSELSYTSEEHYQVFNGLWKEVELGSLPGSTVWIKDVQAVLYKYFDPLLYIFAHKTNDTVTPSPHTTPTPLPSACPRTRFFFS